MDRILHESAVTVRTYFRSRTILSLVVALFIGLAMWVMGVPLPFAVALVDFIGGYIPYFGAFLGGAFAVLLALAEGGPGLTIWAFVVVLAANLALENILEPKILGDSFKLHPIVVLLVTMFGGIVAGLVGLVLAVPLTTITIYIFGELPRFRVLRYAAGGRYRGRVGGAGRDVRRREPEGPRPGVTHLVVVSESDSARPALLLPASVPVGGNTGEWDGDGIGDRGTAMSQQGRLEASGYQLVQTAVSEALDPTPYDPRRAHGRECLRRGSDPRSRWALWRSTADRGRCSSSVRRG